MNLLIANFFGSPVEIAIIAGVVVLLFGGSKLSSFAKSAGEGLKEFKKATREDEAPAVVPPTETPVVSTVPVATTVPSQTVSTTKE